jgi:hypothetical protein
MRSIFSLDLQSEPQLELIYLYPYFVRREFELPLLSLVCWVCISPSFSTHLLYLPPTPSFTMANNSNMRTLIVKDS